MPKHGGKFLPGVTYGVWNDVPVLENFPLYIRQEYERKRTGANSKMRV